MNHPLRWNDGDRCRYDGRSGVIHCIRDSRIATVEFDDEPYVMVDVDVSFLEHDVHL